VRVAYELHEMMMVADDDPTAARPVWRASLTLPEDGWEAATWVRNNATGMPVLSVLSARWAEGEPADDPADG